MKVLIVTGADSINLLALDALIRECMGSDVEIATIDLVGPARVIKERMAIHDTLVAERDLALAQVEALTHAVKGAVQSWAAADKLSDVHASMGVLRDAIPVSEGSKMLDQLTELSASIDPPAPHWLTGGDADARQSFCLSCAIKAQKEGKGECVDGGWCQEADGCVHCTTCGELLCYSLTDFGVKSEVEHFATNPPSLPLSPSDAYHLARVLESNRDDKDVVALIRPFICG